MIRHVTLRIRHPCFKKMDGTISSTRVAIDIETVSPLRSNPDISSNKTWGEAFSASSLEDIVATYNGTKGAILSLMCTILGIGNVYTLVMMCHYMRSSCRSCCCSCINPFLYNLQTKNYKEYLRNKQHCFHNSLNYFQRRNKFQRISGRSLSTGTSNATTHWTGVLISGSYKETFRIC